MPGGRESEFEDLVEPDLYREAFLNAFGVSLDHNWLKKLSRGKWSRRMPTIFEASGTPWDEDVESQAKALVAEAVAASPTEAIMDQSASIIEALVDALERKLRLRTG